MIIKWKSGGRPVTELSVNVKTVMGVDSLRCIYNIVDCMLIVAWIFVRTFLL